MSTQVVLAVDGGNSKTYLALLRADGTLLALVRGTPARPTTSASMAAWRCSAAARRRGARGGPALGGTRRGRRRLPPRRRGLPRRGGRDRRAPSKRGGGRRAPSSATTRSPSSAPAPSAAGVSPSCAAPASTALAWRRTGGRRGFRRSARSPVIGAVATTSVSPRSAPRPGAKTDAARAPRSSRQSRATSACGRRPSSPRRSTAAAFRCAP